MKKQFLKCILILSLLSPAVFAENIRGDVVKHIFLADETGSAEQKLTMNIEDVFAVSVDKDAGFIAGFEIEVKVPQSLRAYSSSFAFNIYKGISPAIESGMGTYYGTRYHSIMMPEAARFFIRIPYGARLEGEDGPYTTILSDIIEYRDSPMMVTILPMMKGFPSSLYNSSFDISVSPILKDSGFLDLSINIPEGLSAEELVISIDGKRSLTKTGIRLTSGSHSLNIEIPGGRSINRNFTVKRGETTKLQLSLEKLDSWAVIDVPENTQIFMDGELLELPPERRVQLAPGEHTVLFKIDDYKISKKFNIQPGKDCKISLFLDIFIEEN